MAFYRLKRDVGAFDSGTVVCRRGSGGVVAPPPTGAFGYLGFRSLSYPYWTTPLAADAPTASTSDAFVSRLVTQAAARPTGTVPVSFYGGGYETAVSTNDYSITRYEVPESTPLTPVYAKSDKYYMVGATKVALRDTLNVGVPLPDLSLLRDGRIQPAGTDGSTIISQAYTAADGVRTSRLWEMWKFREAVPGTDPDGYAWTCQQGGYMEDTRFHPGWWSGSGTGNAPAGGDYGVSAAGFSYAGPMLTGADWNAADILHPLTMALPATGGASGEPDRVLPATRNDRQNFFNSSDAIVLPFRVPEGARFRLDPAKYTDDLIDAYAAANGKTTAGLSGTTPATLAKILRCLRDFGVIIGDSAGVIGFSAEANKTFGTPYNPYTYEQKPNWGNFPQQIPWADLQQLEVPSVQFHTPGSGDTTPQVLPYDFSHQPLVGSGSSLLTAGDVQSSAVSSFTVQGVGTVAYETSWASAGSRSLLFTAGASATRTTGVLSAVTPAAVVPGRKYVVGATVRRGVGAKRIIVAAQWFDGGGALIGESLSANAGTSVDTTTGGVSNVEFTAIAPAGAASANLAVRFNSASWDSAPASGDTFNVGSISFKVGTPAATPSPTNTDLAYLPAVSGRVDAGGFALSAAGSGWTRNSGSSTGTVVTISGDVPSSHFLVGDRSIYLESNGTGGTAIAHRTNSPTTFDMTSGRKIIRVLVYIENAAQIASLLVRFSNDPYGSVNSVSKELDYRFWHEGWNTITFNGNEYYRQDAPDLSAMRYVTVSVRDKNAGTPVRAWVNAIWSEPAIAASSKGAVVFSFDDGYASQHDVVLPILNKYGLKGTAYVMPGNFPQGNTYLTETKAMNLAAAGWTVAAHAWSNAQHVAQTGATLQANFDQTKAWLTAHGITRHHMAYWDGLSQTKPDVLRMIKANFITGRNNLGAGVSLETMRMGQPWGFRGWLNGADGVGNTGTYPGTEAYNTAARSIKNTVIASKGVIVFTWHNVGSDLSAATFETFAKFCADAREAGDLDVLTIDEASVRAGL